MADTQLTDYLGTMKDAPLNDLDVAWEAVAVWGNPAADGERSAATVWKVGDDVDFDALAEDLEDKGYDEGGSGNLPVYTADRSDVDIDTNAIGGVYPGFMFNVLLIELDYEGGARRAADMERTGGGPGVCVPEAPETAS